VNAKAHRADCAEQLRNRSSFDIPPTSLEPAKKINCYTELDTSDSENDALAGRDSRPGLRCRINPWM